METSSGVHTTGYGTEVCDQVYDHVTCTMNIYISVCTKPYVRISCEIHPII